MTSEAPIVSAILIFLNEERFLEEAIASAFAQTFDDWELLLVDDGSTDGSSEIAGRIAAQHPDRVRLLEHPGRANLGMSACRNLGLRHARGRYVAYLDGDDVWLPHKLERQVRLLEEEPRAAMVFGPLEVWFSWTRRPQDRGRNHLHGVGMGRVHPFCGQLVDPPALLALFLARPQFIPAGILVRRTDLERIGGAEEEFRGSYEDAVVQTKLCSSARVLVDGDVSYRYRIHPDSCSRLDRREGRSDIHRRRYLDWVARYLAENGVSDPTVDRALRIAVRRCRHPRLYRLLDANHHLARLEFFFVHWGRKLLPRRATGAIWSLWRAFLRSPSPPPPDRREQAD